MKKISSSTSFNFFSTLLSVVLLNVFLCVADVNAAPCTAVNTPDSACTPLTCTSSLTTPYSGCIPGPCTTNNTTPYPGCSVLNTASIGGAAVTDTADDNMLSRTMCRVMQLVTGKAGKAFAAFAIISVGIGFFTGKLSWSLMISVAAGIAAMFGAPSVVSAITGESAFKCSGN